MNKVYNINLGGYPFTIDEDAYNHLRSYLEAIHNHFRATEGYEEITHDIEARLAELFVEQLNNRPIVGFQEVEDAIAIMGRPEEFGADPMSEGASFTESGNAQADTGGTDAKFKIKTGKRLYRDTEDSVVGGVAAGLTAYFGIADPIWVRLFFVLVVISGGIGIPLYLILWALMPEAKTAGDRLAMRGEPINISNISKIITEEFEHLSEKMTELGEELAGKKKVRAKMTRTTRALRSGSLL
ncbi:MAG: PspC domain-containing protein [Lewinella sp.]|jgi:phage shock protein PspC (stress-responsive transcriptional regulator)|uniref:PspC domain-containing protein n=1 Tax=Lewinella sp. TaxID=2004506 RepID=UPI003D6A4EC4